MLERYAKMSPAQIECIKRGTIGLLAALSLPEQKCLKASHRVSRRNMRDLADPK